MNNAYEIKIHTSNDQLVLAVWQLEDLGNGDIVKSISDLISGQKKFLKKWVKDRYPSTPIVDGAELLK